MTLMPLEASLPAGVRQQAWIAQALEDASPLATDQRIRLRAPSQQAEVRSPDPVRILSWGVRVFLAGLSLALVAALLSAGLAFMVAYCATGALLISLLGYWRETGKAIIAPGTLLVLIAFTAALAITSGIAAVVR